MFLVVFGKGASTFMTAMAFAALSAVGRGSCSVAITLPTCWAGSIAKGWMMGFGEIWRVNLQP